MSFNTSLSGLNASSSNLDVISNNIANASTVGFKSSRAEFGDVYAASVLGTAANAIGSGVNLSDVRQIFNQGNLTTTGNNLDVAISGGGFFAMSNSGAIEYTRAGQFGLDKNGYVVNSSNARLQGYSVDASGNVNGNSLTDLQVSTANQAPARTTDVAGNVNLNAAANVLVKQGNTYGSGGTAIENVNTGTTNGYPAESVTINNSNTGNSTVVNFSANETAQAIAQQLQSNAGVSATAVTTAVLTGYNNTGSMVTLNGVALTGSTPATLAATINSLSGTTLNGVTASVSGSTVTVTSSTGEDLDFGLNNSGVGTDTLTVQGEANGALVGASKTLSGAGGGNLTVGGVVNLNLQQGLTLTGGGGGIFTAAPVATPYISNTFDPTNPSTYNSVTGTTVYDSLGNSHQLTMYFVKDTAPNTWTMYAQIDGQNIGDPNTALPAPQNTQPTMYAHNLVFNNDGSLNTAATGSILVSNWTPLSASGLPNGAVAGQPVAQGGTLPIPNPPTSSNFQVDLGSTTQYGSPFSVNSLSQNGYTTGQLSSLNVSNTGQLQANYTNGQSKTLGVVALANFPDQQGLKQVGNTSWVQTFTSGQPTYGQPGTASLGLLNSGSLEESTVNLSSELVNLITAQSDYQANAKSIQTQSSLIQTVVNIGGAP